MAEYFTEAIVLDRENLGELDSRIFLYTKEIGKVIARATSSRKITSKLSPYLEPLNLIKMRLVEKKNAGFQVADALRIGKFKNFEMLKILNLIKELAAENQPEPRLWTLMKEIYNKPMPINLLGKEILKLFGFDPKFAFCDICHKAKPEYFLFEDVKYLCRACFAWIKVDSGWFKL
jgi:DNA repair protein RecO